MAQFLKDEVKEKIKVSAIKVFTDKGFKKSSIKEIALVAGVSVGNVYRYYKNKEALYAAVVEGAYEGVHKIMYTVGEKEKYRELSENQRVEDDVFEPMLMFIELYRREVDVFRMLLSGEKDEHYVRTIGEFTEMLKEYFVKFWGDGKDVEAMDEVEASALTNALVFSVIDLLNKVDDEQLESKLMLFVTRIIAGYFYMRKVEKE